MVDKDTALKMAIGYAQDVKRGAAIVPTYHDALINACKEALESQEQSACEECIAFNNKLAAENDRLIARIKELERQEQEPVAWIVAHTDGSAPPPYIVNHEPFYKNDSRTKVTPLYTHPAQPLSDDEIWEFIDKADIPADYDREVIKVARAIEKAHGID